MIIQVLFFGMLKDLAGRERDSLELAEGATLGDVITYYEERIPRLRELAGSIAMSLNQEYSGPERTLHPNDEVALLPPVSGGAPDDEHQNHTQRCAFIVRQKIDTQGMLDAIKQPEDGGVVVFEGVVRNNTRGRPTLHLVYEAYEAMALKQLESLIVESCTRFKIRDARIVHRLGRLEIGETSVLIVVASAHRAAAFEACRWLIDNLKQSVPIWKKEYFADGAIWADGEPFPSEIPRAGTHSQTPASK